MTGQERATCPLCQRSRIILRPAGLLRRHKPVRTGWHTVEPCCASGLTPEKARELPGVVWPFRPAVPLEPPPPAKRVTLSCGCVVVPPATKPDQQVAGCDRWWHVR